MNKTIKGYIAGILTMTFLFGVTLVFANEIVSRQIHYGVNVVVNGRPLQLEGIDRPFIMDGRTFLPVSTIAQELGVPTNWDGATRTVHIGGSSVGRPLFETTPTSASSEISTVSGSMSGNSYDTIFRTRRNAMGGIYSTHGWGEFNLNGQFSSVSGILGRFDDRFSGTSTIRFYGDGRELATLVVDGTTVAHQVSVNTSGVLVLRIEIAQPGGGAQIGFANPMLHQ